MREPPEPAPAHQRPEDADRVAPLPDTLELPNGGRLTVRAATLEDVDGLERLYDELSPEDRYRRFFSAFSPGTELIEHWVRSPERGGRRIVVVDEDDRILADGGFEPLPDGDAEFDITVASGARGWLGPYLLDRLVRAAAELGIPNLEADVLADNRRMLGLIRARGFGVLGHDDHCSMRMIIGTETRTPSWPPEGNRPRLLVEARGGRWRGEDAARSRGFDVVVCPGPPRDHPERCPALRGEPCPLAAGADAVVVALRAGDDSPAEQLCDAHRLLHEHPVVFVDEPEEAGHAPTDADLEVLPPDDSAVTAIMDALGLDTSLPKRRSPRSPDPDPTDDVQD